MNETTTSIPNRRGINRPGPTKRTRRHAAKKSRVAALGLSLVTTGVLTATFAKAEPASAASVTTTAKTYTGSVATNRWGASQVKLAVANGRITNVTPVQLPNSKAKSVRLSNNAASIIRTEVLRAQSTNVNTVSGATMTSNSYLASLQSAVDQAQAAGTLTLAR